jgi:hypothetical protein
VQITESIIVDVVERSVIETAEAFIRFRPGFHGDTGIRDYLYHRLMTNLPNHGTYRQRGGGGTLLAQTEWYTKLKYCRKGTGSSCGRFDLGIPHPEDLDLPDPRPLITFECGRNKRAVNLLRDWDAPAEHERPAPADITKLLREIRHKGLPYGYALEFYDDLPEEANNLISKLSVNCESDRLHVVSLACVGGSRPMLRFLPDAWDARMRLKFRRKLKYLESLTCPGAPRIHGGNHGNRVDRQAFFSSCSIEARVLIEALEQRFGKRLRLVFGGKTMTVNRQPNGRLLRITKAQNSIGEIDPVVRRELARLVPGPTAWRECKIEHTHVFP